MLLSFALFSGICPQLLNTHKPSSVAAADVNRHLATAFWCKSSSADTVFKRGAQRETERNFRVNEKQIERIKKKEKVSKMWVSLDTNAFQGRKFNSNRILNHSCEGIFFKLSH